MQTSRISLKAIKDIAEQAGHAALALYRNQDLRVQTKSDGSPVTEADMASEKIIHSNLCLIDRTIPYLSEESVAPSYEERRYWKRFWLVDPLDGTKEFINRTDEFTVNIALIEDEAPVLGVVVAPALGLSYYAARGQGAWKQTAGGPDQKLASKLADPNRPIRIVESASHPSPELEQFLDDFQVKERLKVGSSLKFCLLAEGAADIYPRLGPTMEWDVGAGDCVYRYSAIGDPHPSPLRYNKESLLNDRFVLGLSQESQSLP